VDFSLLMEEGRKSLDTLDGHRDLRRKNPNHHFFHLAGGASRDLYLGVNDRTETFKKEGKKYQEI